MRGTVLYQASSFPCGCFDLDLDLVTGPSSGGGAPAGLLSVTDGWSAAA